METPQEAATSLVLLEARLLDAQRYAEWLELYTEDCVYWAPVSAAQRTPRDGVSHFHDDRQLMMARTHRLAHPRAYGAEPAPITLHVVSDIRVLSSAPDQMQVESSQMMAEYRNRGHFEQDQRLFAARIAHTLRRTGSAWRIALKRIDLINAGGPFNAMAAPL